MGGVTIGPWLKQYASGVPNHQAIVEVGCWLGGGTQYLAHPNLYVYDRFTATASEVVKARAFGVELTRGQDTLPLVRSYLPEGIRFIQGDIRTAAYDGPQIGLYVDDASKRPDIWRHSMDVFEPHFATGAILVLMDYDYPICEVQREYAGKWQMLERRLAGTSAAVFRC